MNYIVLDTEFNQPSPQLFNPKTKFKPNKICPFELIEIGAVKLNERFEQIDTFKIFIKPVIYYSLCPIIKRKTKISSKDLKNGIPFEIAVKNFRTWIGDEDYVLSVWSNHDIIELKRNCNYHNLKNDWLNNYLDVQAEAGKFFDLPKGQQIGLKNAIKKLNIEIDMKFHRALNDAIYTAEVFKLIRQDK
ncbi:3'-5' exonuclease [Wukongibacter baidiensis]|uniref:exonuclease domain-containing protein n=1 Tax=Wukongibacter baidiensis TaxID=1723361 RepID=UPI003D7F1913